MTILNAGRIEQIGPPVEVYRHPKNLFVAGFLGAPPMNLLPGVLQAARGQEAHVHLDIGSILRVHADANGLSAGACVTVGIRPEHLEVTAPPGDMVGLVNVVEHLGNRSLLYVTLHPSGANTGGVLSDVIAEAAGQGPDVRLDRDVMPKPGDIVHLAARPQLLHLFDATGEAIGTPKVPIRQAGAR